MNELAVFEYAEKPIRTVLIDGNVWFVAKDVCDMLDITNHRDAMSRLMDSVKGVATVDTLGGPQQVNVINEAGVYKLTFTSRKPEAEGFSNYVAGTILPTIRRTGQYQIKPMTPAEPIINNNARDQLSAKVRSACCRYSQNYQNVYNFLYTTLEAEAHCDLEARVRNKRDRLARSGALRSQIDSVNRLDVICEDAGLIAHFDRIVQRWAMSLAAKSRE